MRKICSSVLAAALLCTPLAFAAADAPVAAPALSVQVLQHASGSIPVGAQRVLLLSLQFTASCDADVHLSSVTVHHRGLGRPGDIDRVYAMAGTVRKTRSAQMTDPDGIARLQFRGITVTKCSTAIFDIYADFTTTAAFGGEHQLTLLGSDDVATDPPVSVALVQSSSSASLPAPVVRPVGPQVGTVTATFLNLLEPLSYGSSRPVARLQLHADGQYNQLITAITFTNDGSARTTDLQNLQLETPGHTRLSPTVPALEGNTVRLLLQPAFVVHANETRLVELLADVRASRRKTVRFILQEPSDIEAQPVR